MLLVFGDLFCDEVTVGFGGFFKLDFREGILVLTGEDGGSGMEVIAVDQSKHDQCQDADTSNSTANVHSFVGVTARLITRIAVCGRYGGWDPGWCIGRCENGCSSWCSRWT